MTTAEFDATMRTVRRGTFTAEAKSARPKIAGGRDARAMTADEWAAQKRRLGLRGAR